MATDWKAAMADLPPAIVTEHWPFLKALSGYHGPYVEETRPVLPSPRLSLLSNRERVLDDVDNPLDERPLGVCEVCRKRYRMNSPGQRCCTQSCAATLRARSMKDRRAAEEAAAELLGKPEIRECVICRKPMVPDPKTGYRPNRTQESCSRACGTALRAQRQAAAEEERYQRFRQQSEDDRAERRRRLQDDQFQQPAAESGNRISEALAETRASVAAIVARK